VRCARLVVLACLAGCGGRASAPVDVDALLRVRGPVEARRDLVIRVTGDPRDLAGHLALAALDERIGRPGDAIDELEAVVRLGGPGGVRWSADDRARLARLIAARGRARLARGAATAQSDLERARQLGVSIDDDELRRARIAGAIVALRHSDREVRDSGRRVLAAEAATAGSAGTSDDGTEASLWLGARPGASAEQRGRFGAWLWRAGARRAAWDELAAWHAAAPPPHDRALEAAYGVAARWWIPLDRPGPIGARGDAGDAMHCAFAACAPREVAGDDAAERAYLLAPLPPPVRDPDDAAAVVVIALHQALRGEVSWGAAIAARIDLAAFASPAQRAALPAFARPVIAQLAGAAPDGQPVPLDGATPDQRLVIAAGRALAGAGPTELAGFTDGGRYAEALRAVVAPRAPFTGDARSEAAARHAAGAVAGAASLERSETGRAPRGIERSEPEGSAPSPIDSLRVIAAAFRRDPAIADRLGRDAVAGAVDAAAMHATLGALFDAIGDPARARAEWQAAVDASPEPGFLRGLAGAQARQGDADAALITATSAAAASGDPAVVWVAVARSLTEAGRHVQALEAARSAIDLAGPDALAAALDAAIAASQALGRDRQAAQLVARRARVAPTGGTLGDRDPTDAAAALDGYRAERGAAGDAAIARLWTAARWNPRHVELRAALLAALPAGDPRRAVIAGELVDLAGDLDPEVGRAAAAALR
jgi:tetratricopeptide (TPR) repeat protein